MQIAVNLPPGELFVCVCTRAFILILPARI